MTYSIAGREFGGLGPKSQLFYLHCTLYILIVVFALGVQRYLQLNPLGIGFYPDLHDEITLKEVPLNIPLLTRKHRSGTFCQV